MIGFKWLRYVNWNIIIITVNATHTVIFISYRGMDQLQQNLSMTSEHNSTSIYVNLESSF